MSASSNAPTPDPRRVIPIAAEPPAEEAVSLYAASRKIYPRAVQGMFARWRWAMVFATQLVFYGLPWLSWGERQAVLFDLASRRFYLFGLVLYPQDLIYLSGLLVISALSLFLFTAVAGRLWCGYACPQTVYSEIFMWVEQKIEGSRTARIRLDGESLSMEKLVKKAYKHIVWLGIAMWTGFTFVGYFTPVRELGLAFLQTQMGSWEVFWVFFYAFATWGNAGFMREQVCKYMCPYARFQSAMFDKDTLIISYDAERGEPRGARSKKVDPAQAGLGSCIDCTLCVQVCPTGIDIRKGLQYECIGCAACVDACDEVMDKMGYARGLVRYDTQNGLQQHLTRGQVLARVRRPRILIYTAILIVICIAVGASIALRMPFKADIVRDRSTLARQVEGGFVENVYRLQVMNAAEAPQAYGVSVDGLPGLQLAEPVKLTLGPAEAQWVTVLLRVPPETAAATPAGAHEIHFTIERQASAGEPARTLREKSTFVLPR